MKARLPPRPDPPFGGDRAGEGPSRGVFAGRCLGWPRTPAPARAPGVRCPRPIPAAPPVPHPPTPIPTAAGHAPLAGPRRVAYVAPRFPVVSQRFAINEVAEMRRQGMDLESHVLFGEGEPVEDAHAREPSRQTRRHRTLAPASLRAHAGRGARPSPRLPGCDRCCPT